MDIKVYAEISPEHLIAKGSEAGMTDEAINFLRHFIEVPLLLTVQDNGAVTKCNVTDNFKETIGAQNNDN